MALFSRACLALTWSAAVLSTTTFGELAPKDPARPAYFPRIPAAHYRELLTKHDETNESLTRSERAGGDVVSPPSLSERVRNALHEAAERARKNLDNDLHATRIAIHEAEDKAFRFKKKAEDKAKKAASEAKTDLTDIVESALRPSCEMLEQDMKLRKKWGGSCTEEQRKAQEKAFELEETGEPIAVAGLELA